MRLQYDEDGCQEQRRSSTARERFHCAVFGSFAATGDVRNSKPTKEECMYARGSAAGDDNGTSDPLDPMAERIS